MWVSIWELPEKLACVLQANDMLPSVIACMKRLGINYLMLLMLS